MSDFTPLSLAQLNAAWDELVAIHKEYLAPHGVKLPDQKSPKWVWLSVLFHFRGQCVHKDHISAETLRVFPSAAKDQQVRHLKRDGWRIEAEGCNRGEHKLDPYRPSDSWVTDQARRSARMTSESFDELVKRTGSKCLTCGAKEGQPDTRYGDEPITLQQGHMDPSQPAADQSSVIPQCQFCNGTYQDDFTFDDKGRVRAIASANPVKRASKEVRHAVYEVLKEEFGRTRDD